MRPWAAALAGIAALALLAGRAGASQTPAPPLPPGRPPVLRLGSRGPHVQYWRWVAGVSPGDRFDAQADAATRVWQAARGLAADGVVGPATWAAAGVASPPGPGPGGPPTGPTPQGPGPQPDEDDPFGLANDVGTREAQILSHIAEGHADHDWHPIEWTRGGRTARILVSRRALALRNPATDARLVVSTTYPTAQAVADLLGAVLLTTRMSDEIWRQADLRLQPITRPWSQDGTMARTSRMREQSAAVDAAVGDEQGLVANEGKDWVLTRRNWLPPAGTGQDLPAGVRGSRHNPANFGWYAPGTGSQSPSGESVIQSVGLAHGMDHVDYSQFLRFARADSLTIDGQSASLADALADPDLSPLLQDEGGTLPSTRHPNL